MSSLLEDLKNIVTRENVNCIPSDFVETSNITEWDILYVCRKACYGFIQLAVFTNSVECVNWLLSNFVSCIDFERITLPERFVLFLNNLDNNFHDEHYCFVPLLEWCAKHSPVMFLMFLQAGVRSGAEDAFAYVAKNQFCDVPRQPILERMLQMGIGLKSTFQPNECQKWVCDLVEDYRGRRTRCEAVVVRLLGFLKFKKTKHFSGLDPRLLKQMVVTPVWNTRCSECWNTTTEVKKLKI